MPLSLFTALSPFQRSLVSAFAAFSFYGGWAFLVNSMHGSMVAIKAACVQGSYSFLLTFFMTILVEGVFRTIRRISRQALLINLATIVITCGLIFSTSWWVNAMAGTPEIFNTVILGYIIGGIYTTSYVIGLDREQRKTVSA